MQSSEFEAYAEPVPHELQDFDVVRQIGKDACFDRRDVEDPREGLIAEGVPGVLAGALEESFQVRQSVSRYGPMIWQHHIAEFIETPKVVRRHPTYSTLVSGRPPQH